jgi:SAM-dependent methyltransferase
MSLKTFKHTNDPIGLAIHTYSEGTGNADVIRVESDLSEDDEIPVSYLFRPSPKFPELEKIALRNCGPHVLDVGAGTGIHSKALIEQGKQVVAIDISAGAIDYLKSLQIPSKRIHFMDFEIDGTIGQTERFDTLLFLMNGIGIAGKLSYLSAFLEHCKSLLNPGGCILCDSTDVRYFFEDEDGGVWLDLNAEYYGEFQFRMHYKDQSTDWFSWLYIDGNTLKEYAENSGFKFEILHESEDNSFLAKLTLL